MQKSTNSSEFSKKNSVALHNGKVFFTIIMNGEATKFELPMEDVFQEARISVDPIKVHTLCYIDLYEAEAEALLPFASTLLRFMAEEILQSWDSISFNEMKDLMKKAYGICRHTKGLGGYCQYLNAYNNKLVRYWLKKIPQMKLWR